MNSDRPRPRPYRHPAVALSTAEERRRWLRFRRPREPFYKDARVLRGRIRVDVSVRMLLAALVLFVATVAIGAVYVINQGQRLDRAVKSNTTLATKVQDAQRAGHTARIDAQAETKKEVSQLACFFWNFIHDARDPGLQIIAHRLDAAYDCTVVKVPAAPSKPSAKPSPKPSASKPNAAGLPAGVPRVRASSASSTSRSLAPTPPAPTHRSRPPGPSPTPSPTNPPLVDLRPILCRLHLVAC